MVQYAGRKTDLLLGFNTDNQLQVNFKQAN